MTEVTVPFGAHDHAACKTNAVSVVERVCAERKLRLTPLRRVMLELIWREHRPMTRAELLPAALERSPGASERAASSALDFLVVNGFAHKVPGQEAYLGCIEPDVEHAPQLLHCVECGQMRELRDSGLRDALDAALQEVRFDAASATLEVEGVCADCAEKNGSVGRRRMAHKHHCAGGLAVSQRRRHGAERRAPAADVAPDDVDSRLSATHPIRAISSICNTLLISEAQCVATAADAPPGLKPPRALVLKALAAQAIFGVRSKDEFSDRLAFDGLFRWFIGMSPAGPWRAQDFLRERVKAARDPRARAFFLAFFSDEKVRRLLRRDFFSVDEELVGALIEDRAGAADVIESGDRRTASAQR